MVQSAAMSGHKFDCVCPKGWLLLFLAQGRMLAFLLAALVALLGRATVSLLLQCQQAEQQVEAAQKVSTGVQRQMPASSYVLSSGQGADADVLQGGATPQPAPTPGRWRSCAREAAFLTFLLLAANWALAAQGLVSAAHRQSSCLLHTAWCSCRSPQQFHRRSHQLLRSTADIMPGQHARPSCAWYAGAAIGA